MKIFAKTDIGKARSMNQDSFSVPSNEDIKLFILADGMGGYSGGEIASNLAIESVIKYVKQNFSSIQLNKEAILELIKRFD